MRPGSRTILVMPLVEISARDAPVGTIQPAQTDFITGVHHTLRRSGDASRWARPQIAATHRHPMARK